MPSTGDVQDQRKLASPSPCPLPSSRAWDEAASGGWAGRGSTHTEAPATGCSSCKGLLTTSP